MHRRRSIISNIIVYAHPVSNSVHFKDYYSLMDVKIVNVKINDYYSDNRRQFVIDASRIGQILWCACKLTKYLHKFDLKPKKLKVRFTLAKQYLKNNNKL